MNDSLLPDESGAADDHQLGEALASAIAKRTEPELVAPPIDLVHQRAAAMARRRRSFQRLGAAAASFALIAGAVFTYDLVTDPAPTTLTAEGGDATATAAPRADQPSTVDPTPGEVPSPPDPAADPPPLDPTTLSTGPTLTWRTVDPPADVVGAPIPTGDGRVIVASFDEQTEQMALHVTANGTDWDQVEVPGDGAFGPFAADGGHWVIVGVDPAGAPDSGAVTVYESVDSGANWRVSSLAAEVATSDRIVTGAFASAVAVRGDTVVVSMTSYRNLALDTILAKASGSDAEAVVGYGTSSDGNGAVTFEVTFRDGTTRVFGPDDLDLTAAELELVSADQPAMGATTSLHTSVAGAPFVERHTITGDAGQVFATPSGFAVPAWSSSGGEVLLSDDGLTWATGPFAAGAFAADSPQPAATFGGALWSSGWTPEGMEILRSVDGSSWEPVVTFDGLAADQLVGGPSGLLATGTVWQQSDVGTDVPDLTLELDGYDMVWNQPIDGVSIVDQDTGAVVQAFDASQVDVPEGVIVDDATGDLSFVHPDTGEVYLTVTSAQIEQAFADAGFAAEDSPESYEPPERFLAWSGDGLTWGFESMGEALGAESDKETYAQFAVGDGFVLAIVERYPSAPVPVDAPEADRGVGENGSAVEYSEEVVGAGDDGGFERDVAWFVAVVD